MVSATIQSKRNQLQRGFKVPELTVTQTDVLRYVLQCWLSGFLPTVREICAEFNWNSPNAAVTHLAQLRIKGYIEECETSKTGLVLSDKALKLVIK